MQLKRNLIPARSFGKGAKACRAAAKRRFQAAFTFAEVLAALVFMAIVIPVAMEGLQVANRAGVVAQRKGVAAQLADGMLNDLIVTNGWRTVRPSGTFSQDLLKGYRWVTENDMWTDDAMRLVSVEVFYMVQSREYSVRLSTLVQDTN
jgi:type II secretory pathway pseudopilin PulG